VTWCLCVPKGLGTCGREDGLECGLRALSVQHHYECQGASVLRVSRCVLQCVRLLTPHIPGVAHQTSLLRQVHFCTMRECCMCTFTVQALGITQCLIASKRWRDIELLYIGTQAELYCLKILHVTLKVVISARQCAMALGIDSLLAASGGQSIQAVTPDTAPTVGFTSPDHLPNCSAAVHITRLVTKATEWLSLTPARAAGPIMHTHRAQHAAQPSYTLWTTGHVRHIWSLRAALSSSTTPAPTPSALLLKRQTGRLAHSSRNASGFS
jgi:hypothetical protein